jgi:hypothetical protein
MMNFGLTTRAAGALASAALGLSSTANAAPSALSSAKSTVSQLKSQGYHVVVNRVGTAPLDQCTIRAVRPGPKVLAHRLGSSRLHNDVITTVTNNTVYVDVAR